MRLTRRAILTLAAALLALTSATSPGQVLRLDPMPPPHIGARSTLAQLQKTAADDARAWDQRLAAVPPAPEHASRRLEITARRECRRIVAALAEQRDVAGGFGDVCALRALMLAEALGPVDAALGLWVGGRAPEDAAARELVRRQLEAFTAPDAHAPFDAALGSGAIETLDPALRSRLGPLIIALDVIEPGATAAMWWPPERAGAAGAGAGSTLDGLAERLRGAGLSDEAAGAAADIAEQLMLARSRLVLRAAAEEVGGMLERASRLPGLLRASSLDRDGALAGAVEGAIGRCAGALRDPAARGGAIDVLEALGSAADVAEASAALRASGFDHRRFEPVVIGVVRSAAGADPADSTGARLALRRVVLVRRVLEQSVAGRSAPLRAQRTGNGPLDAQCERLEALLLADLNSVEARVWREVAAVVTGDAMALTPANVTMLAAHREAAAWPGRLRAIRDKAAALAARNDQPGRGAFAWITAQVRRATDDEGARREMLGVLAAFADQQERYAALPGEGLLASRDGLMARTAGDRAADLLRVIRRDRAVWTESIAALADAKGAALAAAEQGRQEAARTMELRWRLMRMLDDRRRLGDGEARRRLSTWGAVHCSAPALAALLAQTGPPVTGALEATLAGDNARASELLTAIERDGRIVALLAAADRGLETRGVRAGDGAAAMATARAACSPTRRAWLREHRAELAAVSRWLAELESTAAKRKPGLAADIVEYASEIAGWIGAVD